jgi:hypothetical protein
VCAKQPFTQYFRRGINVYGSLTIRASGRLGPAPGGVHRIYGAATDSRSRYAAKGSFWGRRAALRFPSPKASRACFKGLFQGVVSRPQVSPCHGLSATQVSPVAWVPQATITTTATLFTVSFSGCEGFSRSNVENLSETENPSTKPGTPPHANRAAQGSRARTAWCPKGNPSGASSLVRRHRRAVRATMRRNSHRGDRCRGDRAPMRTARRQCGRSHLAIAGLGACHALRRTMSAPSIGLASDETFPIQRSSAYSTMIMVPPGPGYTDHLMPPVTRGFEWSRPLSRPLLIPDAPEACEPSSDVRYATFTSWLDRGQPPLRSRYSRPMGASARYVPWPSLTSEPSRVRTSLTTPPAWLR